MRCRDGDCPVSFGRPGRRGKPRLYRKPVTDSTIGPGHQQDPQTVKDEHQSEGQPGRPPRACEFFPREYAPESGDHGRGLSDGVGNCYSSEAGGDQIENHADAPDESAEQSEGVAGNRSAEGAGETFWSAD